MAITNGYCTLADAKSALGITDSTDDTLLETLVTVASRLVDGYCERFFYNAVQTRYYNSVKPFSIAIDDLVSVSTLQTDDDANGSYETTWLTTDYVLNPVNATLGSSPRPYNLVVAPVYGSKVFPMLVEKGVKIVGTWGFPSVPDAIQQATVLLTTTLYASRSAPFGVLGGGDTGQVFRLSSRLHPAAVALIEPYRKRGGFAV